MICFSAANDSVALVERGQWFQAVVVLPAAPDLDLSRASLQAQQAAADQKCTFRSQLFSAAISAQPTFYFHTYALDVDFVLQFFTFIIL